MSLSIIAAGTVGIQTVGAGASVAYDNNQASNFQYGIYALEGVLSINDSVNSQIERCTYGIRKRDIESQIIGVPIYGTGANINTYDLDTIVSTNDTSFYRKGSWTPSFGAIATTPTYASRLGDYMRIGDLVSCRLRIQVSAIDNTDTSGVTIIGLPFAPDDGLYTSANISVNLSGSTLLPSTTPQNDIGGFISSGNIVLTDGSSYLRYSECNSSGILQLSITFHAAEL